MTYFVTGATGFIGRFLVDKLIERRGQAPRGQDRRHTIHVLVRKGSMKKFEELRTRWGSDAERVVPVAGDLAKPRLGLAPADIARLQGKVRHFFHLAAVYDLSADAESQEKANIEGTRNAVELAETIDAGCFHLVSSIAAAGLYEGVFREDMFDEAE